MKQEKDIEQLFRRHYGMMYNLAKYILSDDEESKDDYIDKPLVWNASLYQGEDIAFFRFMNFKSKQNVYASVVASPRFGWYNPMVEIDFTQSFCAWMGMT